MRKLFAWLIVVVVIFQAFFIPVSADSASDPEPETRVKSLSETTMVEDFGLSRKSQIETDLIGGSFITSQNPYYWETLTAACENTSSAFAFYLYV